MPQRTIYYYRVEWGFPEWQGITLGGALARCLAQLPNSGDTRLDFRLGLAEVRHRLQQSERLLLHVASWTPGQFASTVPHPDGVNLPDADLATQAPGDDWDYLDGDGMVMVSENHCLILPSGITRQSMERYLKSLLQLARNSGAALPEWAENFQLVPIADDATLQLLFDQGVKSISLHIGQYLETAMNREEARQGRNIVQSLGLDVLMDLVRRDEDRRQIESAENVNARLVISLNSNRRGIEAQTLATIARDVTNEDPNDIEFVTTTNQRFKRGDLIIKRSVELSLDGQTVNYHQAWNQMVDYFDQLQGTGILDL